MAASIIACIGIIVGIFIGIFIENKSLSLHIKKSNKEISTRDRIIDSLNKQVKFLKEGRYF